jgi:putative FmdB family regulatory protein|tara:strand:- start:34 stop:339 length:306 start_codon:yes stop_codon:yes gene_type:complete
MRGLERSTTTPKESHMPIYEYRCTNCGHEMEAVQKISEDPLLNCPACSQDALKKRISAAGFRLKGGGWYETDFKSGKKKNVSGGDSSSGGSSSGASGDSSG